MFKMRIINLLFFVSLYCVVRAKYLPEESTSSILLQKQRSTSDESNVFTEDTEDDEGDNYQIVKEIEKKKVAEGKDNCEEKVQEKLYGLQNDATYIQWLSAELETKIVGLNNETTVLEKNINEYRSFPWVTRLIERKKNILQSVVQSLSKVLPSWVTGGQTFSPNAGSSVPAVSGPLSSISHSQKGVDANTSSLVSAQSTSPASIDAGNSLTILSESITSNASPLDDVPLVSSSAGAGTSTEVLPELTTADTNSFINVASASNLVVSLEPPVVNVSPSANVQVVSLEPATVNTSPSVGTQLIVSTTDASFSAMTAVPKPTAVDTSPSILVQAVSSAVGTGNSIVVSSESIATDASLSPSIQTASPKPTTNNKNPLVNLEEALSSKGPGKSIIVLSEPTVTDSSLTENLQTTSSKPAEADTSLSLNVQTAPSTTVEGNSIVISSESTNTSLSPSVQIASLKPSTNNKTSPSVDVQEVAFSSSAGKSIVVLSEPTGPNSSLTANVQTSSPEPAETETSQSNTSLNIQTAPSTTVADNSIIVSSDSAATNTSSSPTTQSDSPEPTSSNSSPLLNVQTAPSIAGVGNSMVVESTTTKTSHIN